MQPYRATLVRRGVEQSMSRKGHCFDNTAIERFFDTLKAEYFHLEGPDSIGTLEATVHPILKEQEVSRYAQAAGTPYVQHLLDLNKGAP